MLQELLNLQIQQIFTFMLKFYIGALGAALITVVPLTTIIIIVREIIRDR